MILQENEEMPMINLLTIKSPNQLNIEENTSLLVENEMLRKRKVAIIGTNFIRKVLQETLTKDEPEKLYSYDIPESIDPAKIVPLLDDFFFGIFRKNWTAVPDVFRTPGKEEEITINAGMTIRCLERVDVKIETAVESFIMNNSTILSNGNSVIFNQLEHLSIGLPQEYISTRVAKITSDLFCRGYHVEYDSMTNYLTISYSGISKGKQ